MAVSGTSRILEQSPEFAPCSPGSSCGAVVVRNGNRARLLRANCCRLHRGRRDRTAIGCGLIRAGTVRTGTSRTVLSERLLLCSSRGRGWISTDRIPKLSNEISVGANVSAGALPSRSLITNGGKKGRFIALEGPFTPPAESRRRSRLTSRSRHFWVPGRRPASSANRGGGGGGTRDRVASRAESHRAHVEAEGRGDCLRFRVEVRTVLRAYGTIEEEPFNSAVAERLQREKRPGGPEIKFVNEDATNQD